MLIYHTTRSCWVADVQSRTYLSICLTPGKAPLPRPGWHAPPRRADYSAPSKRARHAPKVRGCDAAAAYPCQVALQSEDPRHGTVYAYKNLKCRCDRCRQANSEQCRAYMQRVRESGRVLGEHGSSIAYNSGCRCDHCREEHNRRSRESKRAKRAASSGGTRTSVVTDTVLRVSQDEQDEVDQ